MSCDPSIFAVLNVTWPVNCRVSFAAGAIIAFDPHRVAGGSPPLPRLPQNPARQLLLNASILSGATAVKSNFRCGASQFGERVADHAERSRFSAVRRSFSRFSLGQTLTRTALFSYCLRALDLQRCQYPLAQNPRHLPHSFVQINLSNFAGYFYRFSTLVFPVAKIGKLINGESLCQAAENSLRESVRTAIDEAPKCQGTTRVVPQNSQIERGPLHRRGKTPVAFTGC